MSRTGRPAGGLEVSPRKKARRARARRREEADWRSKAGPVEVRRIDQVNLGDTEQP